MKKFSLTIRAITVLLLAGVLFFSCELAEPNAYGTLVIALPGSGSARTAFDNYITTLDYRVKCSNGVNEVINDFQNGRTTISLSPGDWFVTITVWGRDKTVPVGTSEVQSVTIIAGQTATLSNVKITIKFLEWPSEETWKEYDFSSGLVQPNGTTVAYVYKDGETLSDKANGDLELLLDSMNNQSTKDMDFFMVKLEPNNNTAFVHNTVVYIGNPNSLYEQISGKGFNKEDFHYNPSNPSDNIRWDIFRNDSGTVVNLYMNYEEGYIIILAIKEYSWDEVKWDDYGLDVLTEPDATRVVYISYDRTEGNNTNSKLQKVYGLRSFSHTGFPEFFAVVFLDDDGDRSIFKQLEEQILSLGENTSSDENIRIVRRDDTFTRAIDLYKPANYTILTVRQGENWW